MPSWPEVQAALTGLSRLLRFDAGFVQWFDRSPAGALRSFRLMIPAVPLFLILRFVNVSLEPEAESFRVFAVAAINYVLSWVMFPLILVVIGRAIAREAQAIGALTCYNWFNFGLMVIASAFVLLESTGILSSLMEILTLLLVLASLIYEGFLLRVLMGIGYGGAALLVVIDFALTQSLYILLMSPVVQAPVS